MQSPHSGHFQAALHTLRYISGYPGLGLFISSNSSFQILAFCDSDRAFCADIQRSVSGFFLSLGRCPISWKLKKEPVIHSLQQKQMVSELFLGSVAMSGELSEVMNTLHKISAEMYNFSARQEQLEAAQEHNSKHQEESLNELREVINEVILGGKRPERDKRTQPADGELYSPSDQPFDFGDLAIPNTSNMNTAPVSTFTSYVQAPNLSPRPTVSNPITSGVSSAPIQLPGTQPQPPTRSVMVSNPPLPPPLPYVFPNMPSPNPRSIPLQPLNFPTPPPNGRGYQPLMAWTQGSHTGVIPHQPAYTQSIQFRPSYYTHTGHIPPPLYYQTPYVPTPPQYQYNNITPSHPQTQNNHTTPLPNIPYTKYTKVDFHKFDGEDLRTWLYKVEQIFADEEVTIQQRMKLVSLHFEGDAL
ncbi:PREDICTED: U1 small nuclear ribonucleoprotein C-like [Nicotiana attenuata]|uniref:U1 small nuclear ribonucleoprotein C-like n=1 Tax=Nicotiana attenuata TaxID=49451 RepID=UPI0009058BB4|nr:PREDICTED: U1 small nuclear ribonucleoprotein C-like [Nicotiana attenuata]